jgi:hypothetical protein
MSQHHNAAWTYDRNTVELPKINEDRVRVDTFGGPGQSHPTPQGRAY